MPTLTVTLPKLHPGQQDVVDSSARFKVLACGRRWGKTRLASTMCLAESLRGGRAWWVAPTYPIASIGWRLLRRLARQIPQAEIREGDRLITFPTGGTVQAKSADNPDSLRGEGLDFVALDECAFMREAAWQEALRPALADRGGKAIFISTPKGRNWFWRLYLRGQSDDDWQAWSWPTAANPFIDKAEIEAARQQLPEHTFLQEFMAEFIEDAGLVFRRIREASNATPQDRAIDGHSYVIGVDWGKHLDFTVLAVVDLDERALVYLDRFNQIDYAVQVGRLKALAERFKPTSIIAEANAMGEPLIEQLQRDGMPMRSFTTTNATKTAIIEGLQLAFERGDIRIIPDEVLISELQAYEMDRLPSGSFRYGAPEGLHDDTVMALALAWSGTHRSKPLIGFI